MLESIRHTAHAYWIFFVAFIAYNIVVPAPPAAPPARAKSRYPTNLKIVFNVLLIVVKIKKRGAHGNPTLQLNQFWSAPPSPPLPAASTLKT